MPPVEKSYVIIEGRDVAGVFLECEGGRAVKGTELV